MRPRPLEAGLKQPHACAVQRIDNLARGLAGLLRDVVDRPRDIQEVLADKLLLRIDRRVPLGRDAEPQLDDCGLLPRQRVDFVGAPQIEGAFAFVGVVFGGMFGRHAVGVLGRVKAARLVGHLSEDVQQRVLGDLRVKRIAGELRPFQVRKHELGLVVQHLLEMRDAPAGVDRIAMKAAADMVAHAAERHRAQRAEHHVARVGIAGPRVLAQQKHQLARPGKLRRIAEPAVTGIERLAELHHRPRERLLSGHGGGSRRALEPAHLRRQRFGRLDHLVALGVPHARNLLQDVDEAGLPPLGGRREVGAAVERLEVGRHPHAHRPSAGPGRRLNEGHVHTVDVGPLFAIDLDGHKMLIQYGCDAVAFERLVRHHVTPVTGRIADRDEDRLVLPTGLGKRLVTPRKPVNRIIRVLKEIGTALAREAVHDEIMTLQIADC